MGWNRGSSGCPRGNRNRGRYNRAAETVPLKTPVIALWLTYAAAASLTLFIVDRFVASIPRRTGLLLALLPLLFTGKAFFSGSVYGPADLYYEQEPWKRTALAREMIPVRNPILSDIAFANIPWRSVVREALSNGRFPFWNRFVLGGSPLFPAAGDGFLHPGVWMGIFLPVALSFLFSCTFFLFLALFSAYLFFRDHGLRSSPALLGAVAWGFSTCLLFWLGFAIGPTIGSFPLLLLALRRLARNPEWQSIPLVVVAALLVLAGGHPESFFHCAAAGAAYFLWEISGKPRRATARSLKALLSAAALAGLLAAPLLVPLLDAFSRTAVHQARRTAASRGGSQSVSAAEAVHRLRPAFLPFSHGIYGKSPVQSWRHDASGMPLAYSGALLFPLALVALRPRPARRRGRLLFLAFYVAGLGYGTSAPLLLDATSAIPGFDVSLNYRMVFLAPLGLAGLAAFGADEIDRNSWRPILRAALAMLVLLFGLFLVSREVFRERGLANSFVWSSFAAETLPLTALAAAALLTRGEKLALGAVLLLVVERRAEMGGTYPTLPAGALAPALTVLRDLPGSGPPFRIVAKDDVFRPNAAALYGLEDVRGYEPFVLSELADIGPLWSRAYHASHNQVEDLSRPFLSFLNARFAFAPPDDPVPPGWRVFTRGREMAIFENPRALDRVFVPRRVRIEPDARARLAQMAQADDFAEVAWLSGPSPARELPNGPAKLSIRSIGPDLLVTAETNARTLLATSIPAWPGWTAEAEGERIPVVRIDHAFVGVWVGPGRHLVRLRYRPPTLRVSLLACLVGIALCVALEWRHRRRRQGAVSPGD